MVIDLWGRIDELREIPTPDALRAYLLQCGIGGFESFKHMYDPLDLPEGIYMVTGIEGKYYDGYVPGKKLADGVWVDEPQNDKPWPLQVTPSMSAFDIMLAVAASEANGYPDINHVWFERFTVDADAKTLKFDMGS